MQVLVKKILGFLLKNKYLVLIFLLAAALRLVYLRDAPPSLNWDEVSQGYNAYSILKTGRDEWGSLLPLANFRAYGDYPVALNLYLTIPFIAIFGLSEFSLRVPHAILGSFTVLAAYFLALGLTKSKKVSLITALLVAIEPWSLFLSRFVVLSNLSVFFITFAFAAFFNRDKGRYLFPLSIFFLGLSLFSYHSARIVTPVLLAAGFFIYKKQVLEKLKKDSKVKVLIAVLLLVFFLPLPYLLSRPETRARSKFVFLIDDASVAKIIEMRQDSSLPGPLARLVYNRPTYFIREFTANYVDYFSSKFLFTQGGTQYQFSIPKRGLLYLINLPLFYLGLLTVFKKALRKQKDYLFVVVWLLASPIPAAITSGQYAVVRASSMLPLPMLFSAIGLAGILDWLKSRIKVANLLLGIYLLVLFLLARSYLILYFGEYHKDYSWSWQWGYKEVVEYAKQNYLDYDKIIVTKKYGEPHEFFLFFWPWDPGNYRGDPNLIRFYQSGWYWVDGFDKFYFVNDWEIPESPPNNFVLESGGNVECRTQSNKCLLITSPGNYPDGWVKLETVNFLDGKPAFEILDNQGGYALQ